MSEMETSPPDEQNECVYTTVAGTDFAVLSPDQEEAFIAQADADWRIAGTLFIDTTVDARDFGHFVTGQLHKLNETEILYFMTQVHPDAWPNDISERHLKSVWLHRRSLLAAHRSPRRTCLG
jgi:hypothetical protein